MKVLRISLLLLMVFSLMTAICYGQTAKDYLDKGTAYYHKGMYDEAIAEFKKAIEIDPEFAEGYTNLGSAYAAKGMFDEAIAEFKKAIEINPNDAMAHNNLGGAYCRKGMYDEAVAEYERTLAINPNYIKDYIKAHFSHSRGVMLCEYCPEDIRYGKASKSDETITPSEEVVEEKSTWLLEGRFISLTSVCDFTAHMSELVFPQNVWALPQTELTMSACNQLDNDLQEPPLALIIRVQNSTNTNCTFTLRLLSDLIVCTQTDSKPALAFYAFWTRFAGIWVTKAKGGIRLEVGPGGAVELLYLVARFSGEATIELLNIGSFKIDTATDLINIENQSQGQNFTPDKELVKVTCTLTCT